MYLFEVESGATAPIISVLRMLIYRCWAVKYVPWGEERYVNVTGLHRARHLNAAAREAQLRRDLWEKKIVPL